MVLQQKKGKKKKKNSNKGGLWCRCHFVFRVVHCLLLFQDIMSRLHDERLDDAAHGALRTYGLALMAGALPILVTRRWRVLAVSSVFAMGVATGVVLRDSQRILSAPRSTRVVEEKIIPAKEEHVTYVKEEEQEEKPVSVAEEKD